VWKVLSGLTSRVETAETETQATIKLVTQRPS
jgi:hypothetical protein